MRTLLSILVLFQAVSLAAQVPSGQNKIRGGEEVRQDEFPFVVRLSGGCTGSIVAPNWVLSAAHCFVNNRNRRRRIPDPRIYSVFLGRHRDHPVALRNVRRIVIHPDYDPTGESGGKRDLALLEVFRPFPVSPVKVLNPDEEPPSGSASTSVGWGLLSDGTFPDVLMRVDHSFLTPEECLRTTPWGENRNNPSQPIGTFIDEGVLCFGNEHIAPWDSPWHEEDDENPPQIKGGVAPGDSGGPLLAPIPGGWGQIGIHSTMGGTDLPPLATRTSFFYDFITETISGDGDAPLDFAHFANGTGITSDLVFVNVASQPVRPALYFYDTEGNPIAAESVVDVTGDLEVQEDGGLTVLTKMKPLGELTISTHGQGELVSGSVTVTSYAPIAGMLRFIFPGLGEAGVEASPPINDAIFAVRRQEGGINTGVAIHNLESSPGLVHCDLLREGVLLEEVEIPLGANGQTSWLIDQAFPGTDTSDFVGAVRCDAVGEGRFSAVALEMDPGTRVFITLPVFPVDRGGGGPEAALDFAHFANGDGTTSDLVFVNMKTQPSGPAPTPFHVAIPPIRPVIYFYDTEGAPVSAESVVDLTGDLEITEDGGLTVQTEMEPLGVLTVSTHGQGALVSGSVKVLSDGPIGGMLRYDLPHIGEAVVGASPPLGDAIFPVRRREEGITTGVALHNLESSPGLVHCDLMREGVLRDTASFPLEANGQTSWLIDQAFPAADTSDFTGSVRCDAVGEGRFSAVALEMDPATRTFITLPVVPVPEMPPQE